MSAASRLRRTARRFAVISIICAVFSFNYELFSHGVYSEFMICLFLVPLVCGTLPALIMFFKGTDFPSASCRNLWYPGVATLSVGFAVRGVMDIYGTVAPLTNVYFVVGTVLLISAFIAALMPRNDYQS